MCNRQVEETYLLKVCKRIKMDLLEKILSGKDPGKETNGCVSCLFDWETQRYPLPTKRLQNNDARVRACQKLEL